ncbi:MAG: hypothetical protein ACYC54_00180 [Sedimentisphaerales bacterium]
MTEKYEFTDRGFYLVANKVGEADYFLEMMKYMTGHTEEFNYILSAYVSAARSITFSMQAVMSKFPGFPEWYTSRRKRMEDSSLAQFFVKVRNCSQKIGNVPLQGFGSLVDGNLAFTYEFFPNSDLQKVPLGDVTHLAEEYFRLILQILKELYNDFGAYLDPIMLFNTDGLSKLGWSIEDLEESLGFPRGWTDAEWDALDKDEQRLRVLSRYGGDEMMGKYFDKYEI